MNAKLPVPVLKPPKTDRVVIVLGVVGIDGADDLIGQVEPALALGLGVEVVDRVTGLLLHRVGEVAGQIELHDDRFEIDVLLAGLPRALR